MYKFTRPLVKCTHPRTDMPSFGLRINNKLVHDLFAVSTREGVVSPMAYYGVSVAEANALIAINNLVDTATQAAINAGCQAIQQALGAPSGDVAGMHFSGTFPTDIVARVMRDYLFEELSARNPA